MEAVLLIVTIVSLMLAIGMSIVAYRLLREHRERSMARVEALGAMAAYADAAAPPSRSMEQTAADDDSLMLRAPEAPAVAAAPAFEQAYEEEAPLAHLRRDQRATRSMPTPEPELDETDWDLRLDNDDNYGESW